MSPAEASGLTIVAHRTHDAGVGILFRFVNLLTGDFVWPYHPDVEKREVCCWGESTIAPRFVPFELLFLRSRLAESSVRRGSRQLLSRGGGLRKSQLAGWPRFQEGSFAPARTAERTIHGCLLVEEQGVRNPQVIDSAPYYLRRSTRGGLFWQGILSPVPEVAGDDSSRGADFERRVPSWPRSERSNSIHRREVKKVSSTLLLGTPTRMIK